MATTMALAEEEAEPEPELEPEPEAEATNSMDKVCRFSVILACRHAMLLE